VTASLSFGALRADVPVSGRSGGAGAASSSPGEPQATGAVWSRSCGHCRRAYEAAQWEALPVITALPPASVQAHLSVPAAWTVELRQCACGSMLATRSR
jgi:hypothetical protein